MMTKMARKPVCTVTVADISTGKVIEKVMRALEDNGQPDLAIKFRKRAERDGTAYGAVRIAREYVEFDLGV